jgi:hypothetical protein
MHEEELKKEEDNKENVQPQERPFGEIGVARVKTMAVHARGNRAVPTEQSKLADRYAASRQELLDMYDEDQILKTGTKKVFLYPFTKSRLIAQASATQVRRTAALRQASSASWTTRRQSPSGRSTTAVCCTTSA